MVSWSGISVGAEDLRSEVCGEQENIIMVALSLKSHGSCSHY